MRAQLAVDPEDLHLTNAIQMLLRDKPPVMVLDMGLGSREQGFRPQTPKRVPVTASKPAEVD